MKQCEEPGCGRKYYARGMCVNHYQNARHHGMKPLTPRDRFWLKVALPAVERGDGCWEWAGTVGKHGYGLFGDKGRWLAHRWSYTHLVGPIPPGLHIDHLCCNRRCVRPDHLEAVTQAENNRRVSERQAECKWGHPRTPENTISHAGRRGECRECNRIRCRKYQSAG